MQRVTETYLLECLLEKARKSSFCALLLSNDFQDPYGRWDWLAGFDVLQETGDLSQVGLLDEDPWFGYISYDYKNVVEPILLSGHPSLSQFAITKFVKPQVWVGLGRDGQLKGNAAGMALWKSLEQANDASATPSDGRLSLDKIQWQSLTGREEYLAQIAQIKQHIVEGDFYEMNHCIAYTAEAEIDPYATFLALNRKAPAPFASFFKDQDQYLLCASPERYLSVRGQTIISQPIKGTRKRCRLSLGDDAMKAPMDSEAQALKQAQEQAQAQADAEAVMTLQQSTKDRAENIMIVDLVRNDLSRVCQAGTVQVPELCGVYTYSHVHQMISTVKGTLLAGVGVSDIIHATFPMGSMTGAPKIAVMQHSEQLENFSRGIYSGAVGYVWQGDMDFNVVIRSLMYDGNAHRLSYAVGGAITIDSDAEEEYQECCDKAATVLSIFN